MEGALAVVLLPELADAAVVLAELDVAAGALVGHGLAQAALDAHDLARREAIDLVVLVVVVAQAAARGGRGGVAKYPPGPQPVAAVKTTSKNGQRGVKPKFEYTLGAVLKAIGQRPRRVGKSAGTRGGGTRTGVGGGRTQGRARGSPGVETSAALGHDLTLAPVVRARLDLRRAAGARVGPEKGAVAPKGREERQA